MLLKRGFLILLVLLLTASFTMSLGSLFLLFALSDLSFTDVNGGITAQAVSAQGTISFVIAEGSNETDDSDEGGSSGGSGGGGGGSASVAPETVESEGGGAAGSTGSFSFSPESLDLRGFVGEEIVREISVENTGATPIVIDLSSEGISDLVHMNTNQLTIQPGEAAELILTVIPEELGVFGGRIVFEAGTERKDLLIILNVWTTESLFDVSLAIPQFSRSIEEGEGLEGFVSLLQVGPSEQVDVTVDYVIKDFDGNTLFRESETFFVFGEKELVKLFPTEQLPPGEYIAAIEVVYPDGFATASSQFSVEGHGIPWIWIVVAVVVGFFFFIIWKRRKKEEEEKKKKKRRRKRKRR